MSRFMSYIHLFDFMAISAFSGFGYFWGMFTMTRHLFFSLIISYLLVVFITIFLLPLLNSNGTNKKRVPDRTAKNKSEH